MANLLHLTSKSAYRVLALDDTPETLEFLMDSLPSTIPFDHSDWQIVLLTVKVTFDECEGAHCISDTTITELAKALDTPFDLIVTDYGYVPPGGQHKMTELQKKYPTDIAKLRDEIYLNKLIFHPDIFSEPDESKSKDIKKRYNAICKAFKRHKGKVFIYTYSPPPYSAIVPTLTNKKREFIKKTFPDSDPNSDFVLVWKDIFAHAQENVYKDLDKRAKANLVASLVSRIIHCEALHHASVNNPRTVRALWRKYAWKIVVFGLLLGVMAELCAKLYMKGFSYIMGLDWGFWDKLCAYSMTLFPLLLVLYFSYARFGLLLHHMIEKVRKNEEPDDLK